MAPEQRTFKLVEPHLTGEDVRGFQHDLNARYKSMRIDKRIDEDGDYGSQTRQAAQEVCTCSGIVANDEMAHGVPPSLRSRIRHPEQRTPAEITRSKSANARALRHRLRHEFKGFATGIEGKVVIAPDANKPGLPIQPETLRFVAEMAGVIHKPITITTGTNHDKFAVGGKVSDHFSGHAADIGMLANGGTDDSPVGDRIMEACCLIAGDTPAGAKAKAQSGGLFTFQHKGLRVQCIWKTNEGGNHHNHVHAGARPQ